MKWQLLWIVLPGVDLSHSTTSSQLHNRLRVANYKDATYPLEHNHLKTSKFCIPNGSTAPVRERNPLQDLTTLMNARPFRSNVGIYQRLMLGDEYEADRILLQLMKDHSPDEVYDEMLVPALTYARRGVERG